MDERRQLERKSSEVGTQVPVPHADVQRVAPQRIGKRIDLDVGRQRWPGGRRRDLVTVCERHRGGQRQYGGDRSKPRDRGMRASWQLSSRRRIYVGQPMGVTWAAEMVDRTRQGGMISRCRRFRCQPGSGRRTPGLFERHSERPRGARRHTADGRSCLRNRFSGLRRAGKAHPQVRAAALRLRRAKPILTPPPSRGALRMLAGAVGLARCLCECWGKPHPRRGRTHARRIDSDQLAEGERERR
jgi:hypothetical protein